MPARRAFLATLAACCAGALARPAYSVATLGAGLVSALDARLRVAGVGIAVGAFDAGASDGVVRGDVARTAVFEIGSITKTFTATLLAAMVRAREVSLDDPLERFVPPGVAFPSRGGKRIALIDLATHCSGLPRLPANMLPANANDPYADYTAADAFRFLRTYELPSDPGSRFVYSNFGLGLLGYALSRATRTPYAALVRERIFAPLRMRDSSVAVTGSAPGNLASGHAADGTATAPWTFDLFAGAGSVRSTVDDMLRYLRANLASSGPLASDCAFAQVPRRPSSPFLGQIGLCWYTVDPPGYVWHNGATGGFASCMAFSRRTMRGIVVLVNGIAAVDDLAIHWIDPLRPLTP